MALGNPMPAAVALGIEVVRDEPGRAVCRLVIAPSHLNQGLVAHGGVLFTLADTALGIAANPAGEPTWVGTQFSLQLVRAAGGGVGSTRSRLARRVGGDAERGVGERPSRGPIPARMAGVRARDANPGP